MTIRLRLLSTALAALVLSSAVHPQEAPPLQRPLDPAGDVVLGADGRMAEGALPVAISRSPDTGGPDGGGRYLIVVNSGYGSKCRDKSNEGRQSLQVIDLNASPAPVVVQAVYFPSPQSANVGVAFGRTPSASAPGRSTYLAACRTTSGASPSRPAWPRPISPANDGPRPRRSERRRSTSTSAASAPGAKCYNGGAAPAYPTGLASRPHRHPLRGRQPCRYAGRRAGSRAGAARAADRSAPQGARRPVPVPVRRASGPGPIGQGQGLRVALERRRRGRGRWRAPPGAGADSDGRAPVGTGRQRPADAPGRGERKCRHGVDHRHAGSTGK